MESQHTHWLLCILGDPAVLHALIKSKNLDMNDMDSWNTDSLRALCQACDINVAGMSNVSRKTLNLGEITLAVIYT
jgi:5-methylcytosine-specific restriction endonuclease McrA